MSFSHKFCKLAILCAIFLLPIQSFALSIENPSEIKVPGIAIVEHKNAAALLQWNGHEVMVCSGYSIGNDLIVHNITGDSVVLYRPKQRKYFIIEPQGSLIESPIQDLITTESMPVWKIVRLAAAAHRKDYICSCQTNNFNKVRHLSKNLSDMMKAIVEPNHRYHLRDGIIFATSVHIDGKGWEQFGKQTKHFKSKKLTKQYPNLAQKASIVSNGKPLDQTLQSIAQKTNTNIIWRRPVLVPLYCSFKDRPYHEILATIIIFNGFKIKQTPEGIEIL